MSKAAKGIFKGVLIAICILFLLFVGVLLLIKWAFAPAEYTVTTEQGDKFNVWLDTFLMKGSLKAQNSDLDIYIKYRVEKEDFKCLEHSDDLTVYNLDGTIIFDEGDGFDTLNSSNVDEKDEVVRLVKDKLMSSTTMIRDDLPLLLDSQKYRSEAERIVELARNEKYSELEKYGFDYDLVKDVDYKRLFKDSVEAAVRDSKHYSASERRN